MSENTIYVNEQMSLNAFYAKIYGFVGLGIGLSALVSAMMLVLFPQNIAYLAMTYPWLYFAAGFIELALVMFASGAARKNSPMALPLYITYSALNGFTMTFIIARYAQATVLAAFVSSSLLFFTMAIIGRFIKKDLSGMRKALMAGLIGLLIAGLVNIFLRSSGMSFMISLVSVVIFSGLIAHENQLIKNVYRSTGGQVNNGWAISMALSLYLDFVNLFLSLLRLFGRND